jgi:hypothetical protein
VRCLAARFDAFINEPAHNPRPSRIFAASAASDDYCNAMPLLVD